MNIRSLILLSVLLFIFTACKPINELYQQLQSYLKNYISFNASEPCAMTYEECISNDNFNLPPEMARKNLSKLITLCDQKIMHACYSALHILQEDCNKSNNSNTCLTLAKIENTLGNFNQSNVLIETACKGGNQQACLLLLANTYRDSHRKIQEYKNLLLKECQTQKSSSCYEFALLNKNNDNFQTYLTKACKLGENIACSALENKTPTNKKFKFSDHFSALRKEQLVFNNSVKSITLKCNEGNGDACLLFANLLEETSPSFNVNLHKKHLSKACNMKNFAACLKLANTTPNTDKKLSSLKQLCMSTDVKSTENELAAACIGYYLPQLQKGHESLAFKNFIATRCETNKKTCSLLGLLYLSENNNTQYKTLIMEGCKAGIAHSCFELGMESLLTNDLKNSKNFLQQACSRGFSSACNVLKTLTIMNNDPIEDILQSECFTSPIICWYLGVKKACQGLKEPFSCISSKNHNSNKNLDNQIKTLMSKAFLLGYSSTLYKYKYALVLKNFGEIEEAKSILENMCKTGSAPITMVACYAISQF